MKQWMLGLSCLLMACGALAEGRSAVGKRSEASMLVTGSVEVAPDGSVRSFKLDKPDKLPLVVLKLVQQNLPAWKFTMKKPAATTTKASMSLRIIARPVDDQHDSVGISTAHFGEDEHDQGRSITYRSNPPPSYPRLAFLSRVSGTVYVLFQVGRDGLVKDAIAEQVNLDQYGSDKDMALLRSDLAKASLAAVRRWTFNPPTGGKEVGSPYWYGRVPIDYLLERSAPYHRYGKWNAYIPGPRQSRPSSWTTGEMQFAGPPDAVPDGMLDQGDGNLKLLTSLAGP